jgi:uncharacterized membrane protein YoaK (UPF0700 family)
MERLERFRARWIPVRVNKTRQNNLEPGSDSIQTGKTPRPLLSSRRNLALALSLSALAGYVDGIGFLHLGGLFVSFMSGNSTQLGVNLAQGGWASAMQAFALIALFVAGTVVGSLIVHIRLRYPQCWVLLTEALLLACAALGYLMGFATFAVAPMVLAMGLENAIFHVRGGPGLGLTYVTGALDKVGQLIAVALTGGPRWAWLPNLSLWAALVAGAICGGRAYLAINLSAIWVAAAVALILSGIVFATAERRH